MHAQPVPSMSSFQMRIAATTARQGMRTAQCAGGVCFILRGWPPKQVGATKENDPIASLCGPAGLDQPVWASRVQRRRLPAASQLRSSSAKNSTRAQPTRRWTSGGAPPPRAVDSDVLWTSRNGWPRCKTATVRLAHRTWTTPHDCYCMSIGHRRSCPHCPQQPPPPDHRERKRRNTKTRTPMNSYTSCRETTPGATIQREVGCYISHVIMRYCAIEMED